MAWLIMPVIFNCKYSIQPFLYISEVFDTNQNAPRTRLMNVLMQLRKCVNHPYLFDGETSYKTAYETPLIIKKLTI